MVFVGLALRSVILRYPRELCNDCFSLFGLLFEFLATLLGSLLLATATFHWVANRRQAIRVAWYPAWSVCCWSIIVAYLVVYGPDQSLSAFRDPLVFGGIAGVIQEVRSW